MTRPDLAWKPEIYILSEISPFFNVAKVNQNDIWNTVWASTLVQTNFPAGQVQPKGLCFATSGVNTNSSPWRVHSLVGVVSYALGLYISRENMVGSIER